MTAQQSRGVRYLLGRLPEAEAHALAEELFANDATFSELQEAEDGLVEAYLDDELEADDRQRFESLFHSSSHLRERVELERGLRARDRAPRASVPRAVPWLPWAAALLVGVTGGGLALRENRQAMREREAASVREQALATRVAERTERVRALEERLADHDASPIEVWRLSGGSQRAAGGAAAFRVASTWVRLRILQDDAPAGASYRASLASPDGRELFRVEGLAAGRESGTAYVDVIVPGGVLPRGTYILSLTRVAPAGPRELGPYAFSVRP